MQIERAIGSGEFKIGQCRFSAPLVFRFFSQLTQERKLESLLRSIATGLVHQLDAQTCRLYVLDAEADTLHLATHRDRNPTKSLPVFRIPLAAQAPETRVVQTRQVEVLSGGAVLVGEPRDAGVVVTAPLFGVSGLFGVVSMSFTGMFAPHDNESVAALASMLSALIEKTELRSGPSELEAFHDALRTATSATRVKDYRSAQKNAEEERARAYRELERERGFLRAVIENAPVGVLVIEGANCERIVSNPRCEDLLGHKFRVDGGLTQYGGRIYDTSGRQIQPDMFVSARSLRGEVVYQKEVRVVTPDGRTLALLISGRPIRAAEEAAITGGLILMEDITSQRELERRRDEWTRVIVHDLRQPLGAIQMHAALLARRDLEKQLKPSLEHIVTSSQLLSRMISDLDDMSALEARQLTLRPSFVNLAALISGVVQRSTKNTPIRIHLVNDLPGLNVDPQRFEQLLSNLLTNAEKYSYPGTSISVDVMCRDSEVQISVSNSGEGIPHTERERVFERFHRVGGARERRVRGLGLGLYITRGLVEAHGGRIWLECEPGQTTTVHFTLPTDSRALPFSQWPSRSLNEA